MTDFKQLMDTSEHGFLRTEKRLGNRVILLGLGGSYVYGMCNENSDIDFRGIILNVPSDLIRSTKFEQYEDTNTDTVVYSFNKIVGLLLNCNPNICEILDLDEDQCLTKSKLGQELLDHKGIFLSKWAARPFGGYAGVQLRRLQNAITRDSIPQTEKEQHILRSVRNVLENLEGRYSGFDRGSIRLYIDRSENPELGTEIYMDASYRYTPLRDYKGMWAVIHSAVRDYDKIGERNRKKNDNHLNKHIMRLTRLFMMAVGILEKGEININRRHDLDLLVKTRSRGFREEDGTSDSEFCDILAGSKEQLQTITKEGMLPDNPDMEKVGAFVGCVDRGSMGGDY